MKTSHTWYVFFLFADYSIQNHSINMRLKGGSCIYFITAVHLLNYAIKLFFAQFQCNDTALKITTGFSDDVHFLRAFHLKFTINANFVYIPVCHLEADGPAAILVERVKDVVSVSTAVCNVRQTHTPTLLPSPVRPTISVTIHPGGKWDAMGRYDRHFHGLLGTIPSYHTDMSHTDMSQGQHGSQCVYT